MSRIRVFVKSARSRTLACMMPTKWRVATSGCLRSEAASTFLPIGNSAELGVARIRQMARKGTGLRGRIQEIKDSRTEEAKRAKSGWRLSSLMMSYWTSGPGSRRSASLPAPLTLPDFSISRVALSERQMLTVNVKLERSMNDHQTRDCCPQTASV
jgi:hypothetical protein